MRTFTNLLSPGRIILALSVLIAGYLLFSAGGNLLESHRLAENEDQVRLQVENLQAQQKQLEQIRDYLRSDEYIEFMARRVFGLVKPGESLVVVRSSSESVTPTEADQAPGQPWWQQLFGR